MLLPILAVLMAGSPWGRVADDSWSIGDGLPQSSVTAIDQGPGGWLYVGTFGGVARFDGRAFQPWDASRGEGWSSIRVTALAVAADGTQWVGLQDGGVVVVPPSGKDYQLPAPPGLVGGAIWDIAVVNDTVWVAGQGGSASWDGHWEGLGSSAPARAIVLHDGAAWIGGADGLTRVEGEVVAVDDPGVGEVLALDASGGELLVGGEQGLVRKTDRGYVRVDDGLVEHLARTSDGTIWIGAGQTLRSPEDADSFDMGSSIRELAADREGDLWVGTNGRGLVRIHRNDWEVLDLGRPVLPLFETSDGQLLAGFGCEVGGLVQILEGPVAVARVGGCVRAVAETGSGDLWIGAGSTLGRLTAAGDYHDVIDVGHDVLAIEPVGRDIAIGTDSGGAFMLRGTQLEPLPLGQSRVLAIETGPMGEIWFGTHRGLTRYDHGTVTHWSRADGAPAAAIRALHVDDDGTVLMGSYGGGFGILRDGELRRLTVEHGLADNVVSAILDDGRGAIWLHGNRGLTRLMRSDLEAWWQHHLPTVAVRHWHTPEGMGGGQPAGIVARDGALMLPTVAGIVRLHPAELHRNAVAPEVVVLRSAVDGVPLSPGTVARPSAGPGRVRIEFTAATLRHPELTRFEYRLSETGGEDGPWTPTRGQRSIGWDGVEPGDYRIDLRAANEDGVWSPTTSLAFELPPHWYERWGVRLGFAGLLLLGAVSGHRWRTATVTRHNTALRREVEQRRNAVAALRRSEGHYRRVFEGGSDGLFVLDAEGRVEQANEAATRLCGAAPIGKTVDDLFAAPDPRGRQVRKSNPTRWVELAVSPFEQRRQLVRAADVSRRVTAEEERRALSARLSHAQRMEAVGRLAGGIAHDFNNLLTAILGSVARMRDALPAEERAIAQGVERCVDRGSALTRQLLAFARRQHLEPKPIDAAALPAAIEGMLRPSLRDNVLLRIEPQLQSLWVHVDAAQLELAVINLVLNAQDAIPRAGAIEVHVREADDATAREMAPDLPPGELWTVLEVEDTGDGIPPEDLPRVLEPFFTTRAEGTGLGLPSVLGFAVQSGGGLAITSTVGQGTTVRVLLPRIDGPIDEVSEAPREHRQIPRGTGRVLICDDDDLVREAILRILEMGGYTALAHPDPEAALAAIQRGQPFDLVITDVLMPQMSGPEFATAARRIRPQLPFVFISGYTRDAVREALPGPLVSKPFRRAELLEVVASVLGGDMQSPPP